MKVTQLVHVLGGNDIALLGPVASFNHWLQFLFPVFAKPEKEEGE